MANKFSLLVNKNLGKIVLTSWKKYIFHFMELPVFFRYILYFALGMGFHLFSMLLHTNVVFYGQTKLFLAIFLHQQFLEFLILLSLEDEIISVCEYLMKHLPT